MPGKRKPMLKSSDRWPSPKPCCFVVTVPAWFAVGTKQHVNDREDSGLPTHGLIHVIPIYLKISLSPGRSIQAWMYSTIWLYLLRLETKDEWWIYWHCVFLFHIVICSHIELLCPLIHVTQLKSRTGLCPQVCLGLVTNRLIITTAATQLSVWTSRIPTACHGGKIMNNQQQP